MHYLISDYTGQRNEKSPFNKDPCKNAHYIPFPSSKSSPGAVKVIVTPDEGSMLSTATAFKSSIRPGGILILLLPFLTLRNNKKC